MLIHNIFLFLTSFCIRGSRLIHLTGTQTFLYMADQYSFKYMYHNFFIHSSANEHLPYPGYVNSATMNTGVHVPLELYYTNFLLSFLEKTL